jgi:serine/threonine protein kinase
MIGQTIGSYRITAKLGAGGMGEVYRARDTKLDYFAPPQELCRFRRGVYTTSPMPGSTRGSAYNTLGDPARAAEV